MYSPSRRIDVAGEATTKQDMASVTHGAMSRWQPSYWRTAARAIKAVGTYVTASKWLADLRHRCHDGTDDALRAAFWPGRCSADAPLVGVG